MLCSALLSRLFRSRASDDVPKPAASPALPCSRPEGRYIWNEHFADPKNFSDRRGIFFSNELLVCEAASQAIAAQFSYLQNFWATSEVTLMVLDRAIKPALRQAEWLAAMDAAEADEKFGWSPETTFKETVLNHLPGKAFDLYHYLASLERKKKYSVENTPASAGSFLEQELSDAYLCLETQGLLKRAGDFWEHSPDTEVIELRTMMNLASSNAHFLLEIERNQRHALNEHLDAQELHAVYLLERKAGREDCACPICSWIPNSDAIIELNKVTFIPFHFQCGEYRPLMCMREFALSTLRDKNSAQ